MEAIEAKDEDALRKSGVPALIARVNAELDSLKQDTRLKLQQPGVTTY